MMMFFTVPINDCYSCGQKYIASTCPHCEITRLRAQLAAAEADRLAAMERVREAAISAVLKACSVAGSGYKDENERLLRRAEREAILSSASAIRAIKLDALAEGEK